MSIKAILVYQIVYILLDLQSFFPYHMLIVGRFVKGKQTFALQARNIPAPLTILLQTHIAPCCLSLALVILTFDDSFDHFLHHKFLSRF